MDDEAMFAITPALGAALRSAAEATSSGRAATREALVTFKLRVLGLLDILAKPSAAPGELRLLPWLASVGVSADVCTSTACCCFAPMPGPGCA